MMETNGRILYPTIFSVPEKTKFHTDPEIFFLQVPRSFHDRKKNFFPTDPEIFFVWIP